jgi:hypothetical protein
MDDALRQTMYEKSAEDFRIVKSSGIYWIQENFLAERAVLNRYAMLAA